jgi:hypothetical protein
MDCRVKKVKAIGDMKLLVHFKNNVKKQYDVRPLIKEYEPFEALEYIKGLFDYVHVVYGGYGIAWNDEIDIACEELWENGKAVK